MTINFCLCNVALLLIFFTKIVVASNIHNDTFSGSRTEVRCLDLGTASHIYSELLWGGNVLVSDGLDPFNVFLPVNRGNGDNLALKFCVHIQLSENDIVVISTDHLKGVPDSIDKESLYDSTRLLTGHIFDHDVENKSNGREIDHLAPSVSAFSSSSTTIVFVNSLVDSIANTSACAVSTSPPSVLSGNCNLRSAVDYCTLTWNYSTSDECIIYFPPEETMSVDPSLGEIIVPDVGGFLVLEGNNCTVTLVPGASISSRFMFVEVSLQIVPLHFHIRNLILDSFGGSSLDGGVLYASGLASLTIEHVTFSGNQASNGGALFLTGCGGVDIFACTFLGASAVNSGGAILVDRNNNSTAIYDCHFVISNAYEGGAVYVGQGNYGTVITDCTFVESRAGLQGGSIMILDNNGVTISRCSFASTKARLGGAIYVYQYNTDLAISECSFADTGGGYGGAIFADMYNNNMTISACSFTNTSGAFQGGSILVSDFNKGVMISDCYFFGTTAPYGGSIFIGQLNNDLVIANSVFSHTGAPFGGAIFIDQHNNNLVMSNCSFSDSRAGAVGGALFITANNYAMSISKCSFTNSFAELEGGAIYMLELNSFLALTDCTFHNTSAVGGGALLGYQYNTDMLISKCNFTDISATEGGAISFSTNSDDALIVDCYFKNARASIRGGAVNVDFSNYRIRIVNSVFVECSAANGGAIFAYVSNFYPEVFNSTFTNCTATEQGGALYIGYDNDDAALTQLSFIACSAVDGGAVYIAGDNDNISVANISFVDNSASGDGGAMLIRDTNHRASVTDTEFISNAAGSYGGALAITSNNLDFLIENCVFRGNVGLLGGGAVESTLANSGIMINDCVFESNSGSYGGSLYFGTEHIGVRLSGCVVKASSAEYGAAIYYDQFSTGVSLVGCTLEGNVASEQGGAVFSLATDLLMHDCKVLSNAARTGGGVHYPSDRFVDYSNISSCLFDGNTASEQYGSVYVELASSVTITSSNFTRNTASMAGAVGVKGSSVIHIEDCLFVRNAVNESAGAVYLESDDGITLTGCLFDGNIARTGSGAAVWLSSSAGVTIEDNQFVGNSAIGGGGAVHWLVSSGMTVPAGLESTQSVFPSGNYFGDNIALYGGNVSTDSYTLSMSQDDVYDVTNYEQYIPPVIVYMMDYYNQIVRVESSDVAVAAVLSTTICYGTSSGFVTDGFIRQAQAGVFNFSALSAYCDPGYSLGINVTSGDSNVKSVYFTVSFRSCVRGEYYQDSICILCDEGTYSLTDPTNLELSELSNSDVCKHCPSGAEKCFGDTIQLKKGYWRINENSSALQNCPYGEHACIGGTGSGNSLCREGYVGALCAVCDDGYAYRPVSQKCELCSDSSSFVGAFTVIAAVFVVILASVFGYIIYSRKIKNSTELYIYIFTKLGLLDPNAADKELRARFIATRFKSVLKIYVTLWQIASIMPFALDLNFPDAYTAIIAVLNAVNIDVSRSSLVSCSGGNTYDFIDSLVVDTIGPILFVIVLWLVHLLHLQLTTNRSELSDKTLKSNYYKAFLVFTYLILPSVSAKIFQTFSCKDVDPDDDQSGDDIYMTVDYSVSCTSQKYHFGRAWAIVCIIVYPVGIPAYYLYELYNSRVVVPSQSVDRNLSEQIPKQHIQHSIHHPKYWYWEVVETIKRLMLTGVLVLIVQGSAVQIVVGIFFSVFFIELYGICSPFVDPTIARLESVSQRQILCVFFLALLVKADFESISRSALGAFLIFALFGNVLFLMWELRLWRQSVNAKKSALYGTEPESEMVPPFNHTGGSKKSQWDNEDVNYEGVDETCIKEIHQSSCTLTGGNTGDNSVVYERFMSDEVVSDMNDKYDVI